MTAYRIEAASEAALISKIEAADGSFVVTGEGGVKRVRQSCVTNPARVTEPGVPISDGEGGSYVPQVPVDPARWYSEIETEENPALVAIAVAGA